MGVVSVIGNVSGSPYTVLVPLKTGSVVVGVHSCEKGARAAEIYIPVAQWFGYRLAHGLEAARITASIDRPDALVRQTAG